MNTRETKEIKLNSSFDLISVAVESAGATHRAARAHSLIVAQCIAQLKKNGEENTLSVAYAEAISLDAAANDIVGSLMKELNQSSTNAHETSEVPEKVIPKEEIQYEPTFGGAFSNFKSDHSFASYSELKTVPDKAAKISQETKSTKKVSSIRTSTSTPAAHLNL